MLLRRLRFTAIVAGTATGIAIHATDYALLFMLLLFFFGLIVAGACAFYPHVLASRECLLHPDRHWGIQHRGELLASGHAVFSWIYFPRDWLSSGCAMSLTRLEGRDRNMSE